MLENNPVLDAIRSRRSIRKYTGEPIAEPVRRAILEAGFYAPSAMNRRPFHFVSITDRELMQKLSDLHPYAKMLPQADWAIISHCTTPGTMGLPGKCPCKNHSSPRTR